MTCNFLVLFVSLIFVFVLFCFVLFCFVLFCFCFCLFLCLSFYVLFCSFVCLLIIVSALIVIFLEISKLIKVLVQFVIFKVTFSNFRVHQGNSFTSTKLTRRRRFTDKNKFMTLQMLPGFFVPFCIRKQAHHIKLYLKVFFPFTHYETQIIFTPIKSVTVCRARHSCWIPRLVFHC